MATERQLEANRANSVRSTGPKSLLGKARSSMNACKHGLTAQAVVIEDEDPAQFDVLRHALQEEFEPHSLMERELVERLAGIMWRIRRIPKFEAALIEARCEQARHNAYYDPERRKQLEGAGATGAALMLDSAQQDTLGKLSRHEAALMNAFTKTLQMLHFMQSQRALEDDPIDAVAIPSNGLGADGLVDS
jgi:hypothetical protein